MVEERGLMPVASAAYLNLAVEPTASSGGSLWAFGPRHQGKAKARHPSPPAWHGIDTCWRAWY
jgi:hypothetical protein